MTRSLLFAVAAAALVASLAPLAARAEESCPVSGPIKSHEAMTKSLQERGYVKIRSLSTHNGCYEAKGLDTKGHRFELEPNGSSGAIVNQE